MNRPRKIALAAVGAILVFLLIKHWLWLAHSGVLKITTNDPKAQIVAVGPDGKDHQLGKGSGQARLAPGAYNVTAQDQDTQTVSVQSVIKKQTTEADLELTAPKPVAVVAPYNGRDILVGKSELWFLNAAFNNLNHYRLRSTGSNIYLDRLSSVSAVRWKTPSRFYWRDGQGDWLYWNGHSSLLVTSASSSGEEPPAQDVSFNKQRDLAYTTRTAVFVIKDPHRPARKLASLGDGVHGVSLSPKGAALVFPVPEGVEQAAAATPPTLISAKGKHTDLPDGLNGLDSAAWSTDSQQVAFTKSDGLYIWQSRSNAIKQVFTGRPTHPGSATWLDSSHLVYAQGNDLWLYDLTHYWSQALTAYTGSLAPIEPFSFGSGQSVYYGTDPDTDGHGGQIYRLQL